MTLTLIHTLTITACIGLLSAPAIASTPVPLDPDKFKGTWIIKDEKTGDHCLMVLQSNGKRGEVQVAYSYNSFWEFLTWSDCEKVLDGKVRRWAADHSAISIIAEPRSDGKVNSTRFNSMARTIPEVHEEDFVSRDGLALSRF